MTVRALVGVVHRPRLDPWIRRGRSDVQCLELSAERFYKGSESRLRTLASTTPLLVHGTGLSLGSPGPADPRELDWFARVVEAADPLWISEHLGFRRAGGADLVRPTPFRLDAETLRRFATCVEEVVRRCGKRLLITNVASPLRLPDRMSEPDFLGRLCDATGSGVRLDVAALIARERNRGEPTRAWLDALDPARIVQLQLGGLAHERGYWLDAPARTIPEEVWQLAEAILAVAPAEAIVLRSEADPAALAVDLQRARRLAEHAAREGEGSSPGVRS